jgi:hypothetical protein
MELSRGLTIIDPAQAYDVKNAAAQQGVPLYVISPGGQAGRDAFFDAVRHALPLDPPVVYPRWDALSDSLWKGIRVLDVPRVAILWPDSSPFSEESPRDFELALSVLRDVTDGLAILGR